MPAPERKDYRVSPSPMATVSGLARNLLRAQERRNPGPEMMSATVVSWDGASGTAWVELDRNADTGAPEKLQVESHIGIVFPGQKVWVYHVGKGAAYLTGTGAGPNWLPVPGYFGGAWAPYGRDPTDATVTVPPSLGVGGIADAGYHISNGLCTMSYAIVVGQNATSNPGGVHTGMWVLPLPYAIATDFGWSTYTHWAGGDLMFHDVVDNQDWMGTHFGFLGEEWVMLRLHNVGNGSLGYNGTWPHGGTVNPSTGQLYNITPAYGTVLLGTLSYPISG